MQLHVLRNSGLPPFCLILLQTWALMEVAVQLLLVFKYQPSPLHPLSTVDTGSIDVATPTWSRDKTRTIAPLLPTFLIAATLIEAQDATVFLAR